MPLKAYLVNPKLSSYHSLFQLISPLTRKKDIERLRSRIIHGNISWENLIHMANMYLITPALWVGLVNKSLHRDIESDVIEYLQGLHALNKKRNQALRNQAIEVVTALNKVGIVPMLIKGAVQLFQPLHLSFGTRIMADLDMVVHKDAINDAVHALIQLGYKKHPGKDVDYAIHHHVAPMARPGDYGAVELHRSPLGVVAEPILSAREIWKSGDLWDTAGIQFKTPHVSHAVLIGFLHSQIVEERYKRVLIDYKGLYDMVVVLSKRCNGVDFKQIQSRLTKHGCYKIFQTYLWTAHRLFHMPMPRGIRPHMSSHAYHALCLARIRWKWMDMCIARYFSSFLPRKNEFFRMLRRSSNLG